MSKQLRHYSVTTQLLSANDPGAVPTAAAAIRRGELIILPTDTVYGIGSSALDNEAVLRLISAKQRPREKGIPILIADVGDLDKIVSEVSPLAKSLIAQFWPGPLTIILPKHENLPTALTDTDRVAVRLPDHDFCRRLIRLAGGALAASSANLSGQAPATNVKMAVQYLAGTVSVAIDGGPSGTEQASTVVECVDDTIRILRSGPLTLKDLEGARKA
jgi:L-threonylcarbamoyladenylate synthase